MTIPPIGAPLGGFYPEDVSLRDLPPAMRAEKIDVRTGELESVLEDLHPIDAQVVEALIIVRASGASVMTEGQQFLEVRHVSEDGAVEIQSQARRALLSLINAGSILIESISVESGPDWYELVVKYFNLRLQDSPLKTARRRVPTS